MMDAFAPIREFADFTNNRQPDYPGFYSQQQERPYGRKGGNQLQQLAANSNARGGQQMLQKRRFNRRTRPTTEFPFVPLPNDAVEYMEVPITRSGVYCFHGFASPLTLQHKSNFQIDGNLYKSVDQYYQSQKVKELTGIESKKFLDNLTKNYSGLARELLKQNGISREQVDKWRTSRGVLIIQNALLEKARQCDDYKQALIKTGENIIVQSYAGDDFFGAGVPFKYCKDWCDGMEKNKATLKFPMTFPLTGDLLKSVPKIAKGRNVLGAIHMILREKLGEGHIDELSVDIDTESAANQDMDFAEDADGVDSTGGTAKQIAVRRGGIRGGRARGRGGISK